jgi:hypothetical protein
MKMIDRVKHPKMLSLVIECSTFNRACVVTHTHRENAEVVCGAPQTTKVTVIEMEISCL